MLNVFDSFSSLQKGLVVSILSIVLFVASAGASYSVFSASQPSSIPGGTNANKPGPVAGVTEDPQEPKTESCLLNGQLHTKKAKDSWANRIPIAVMIENSTVSRPQSGLSSADIVYEAVAEGGITRFMGVFLCNYSDVQVGPVRSARTYFIDWLSEYDPLYAHVGGANTPGPADALGQIEKYKIKDLNQMYRCCGFPTYWRDETRTGVKLDTEHTVYSSTEKLWAAGIKWGHFDEKGAGMTWEKSFTPWKFKKESADQEISAGKIDVYFWSNQPDYAVSWGYDKACNCYKRKNGGSDHIDFNTKQTIAVKNVVVQFQKESRANDGYEGNLHMIYGTIGTGKALIFQDGKVIEGKWSKASRVARTKYTDAQGKEIAFNGGLIWIQTVPEGVQVTY